MDGKYIFAIIVLSVFFLLILISFAFLEYGRNKQSKLQAWINERYADKDLNSIDYDTVMSDEEIPEQRAQTTEAVSDEADDEEIPKNLEEVYGKIEVEGIEEITGNYDGNK